MTTEECRVLVWNSSVNGNVIDKTKDYIVPVEDIDFEIGPYTRFEMNGTCVRVSGLRLFHLKQIAAKSVNVVSVNMRARKKSCRNVCFASIINNKTNVVKLIRAKLNLPPCMDRLLKMLETSPRGDRFKKRFVFNCYVANLLTCTKCCKTCIIEAMYTLYDHDDKCTREVVALFTRDEEDVYKPPNCVNMKRDKMCFRSLTCKGANPLCNK
ncbi:late expression factor 2 [Orgyia leucostigma nucleopolyhedrovirus]|uniref:Late expression factor 2 n=1 Tax=Orgyia leucostigma nucleopolyhedrovirus TaxID=490711 RepID=B0FDY2_9ABAC|nr:late expression factor 2 [Orgyia leucostigma nucleopolyhedrovirus]ABY65840.1 late expression factor 2 [Orgyia leucostigma nucleopolyhedrovirus]